MTLYDRYLHQVTKGTYLRKREKRALAEEMGNHLQESAERFMQDGHKEEEAYQYAIEAFGPARERAAREPGSGIRGGYEYARGSGRYSWSDHG